MPDSHNFIVGTFNTPHLYTISFQAPSSLSIVAKHPAVGSHSWLHLNETKTNLYATAWTEPPSVVAYSISEPSGTSVKQISLAHTATRSGYVTATSNALFSAGGPSGEVVSLDPVTGEIVSPASYTNGHTNGHTNGTSGGKPSIAPLQKLNFLDGQQGNNANGVLDFGGLRHGAHSADLSPDNKAIYVADIGRNCIWTYAVAEDGSTTLDEVRTSFSNGSKPKYMYASTRGLEAETKGYLAVFALTEEGRVDEKQGEKGLLDMWQTPTSGGWANAVQPGPTVNGVEYLALTDSEEGLVMVLSWDGKKVEECGRVKLQGGSGGKVEGAATAVWLS